jgi:flagellar protein FlaG
MHPSTNPPSVRLENSPDYREHYANSVQLRTSLWDFFLMFGTVRQQTQESVTIQNFEGVFLSPQQAKALLNVLATNVQQYESTFGEIHLAPQGEASLIQ